MNKGIKIAVSSLSTISTMAYSGGPSPSCSTLCGLLKFQFEWDCLDGQHGLKKEGPRFLQSLVPHVMEIPSINCLFVIAGFDAIWTIPFGQKSYFHTIFVNEEKSRINCKSPVCPRRAMSSSSKKQAFWSTSCVLTIFPHSIKHLTWCPTYIKSTLYIPCCLLPRRPVYSHLLCLACLPR